MILLLGAVKIEKIVVGRLIRTTIISESGNYCSPPSREERTQMGSKKSRKQPKDLSNEESLTTMEGAVVREQPSSSEATSTPATPLPPPFQTARECAKDLLSGYVALDWTLEDILRDKKIASNDDYAAQQGGKAEDPNGKIHMLSHSQIVVTRLGTTPCWAVFNVADIVADLHGDKPPTKAQVIAAILDQPDIQFVDWKALMGEGVVVKLHIRRVRFRKRLQFEDLGIHFPDRETAQKMHEVFRLGMKNLLTKEYLDRIEQIEYKARKVLVAYSYDTIWGPFIPVTAYMSFREQIDLLEQEYYQVCQDILSNYAAITKQVLADYVRAAGQAYRILNKVDPEVLTEREQQREIFYLAAVRRKVRKMLPTPEDIRQSFSFEVSPTYIDLPLLAGEEEEADLAGVRVEKRAIEDITEEEQRELRWRQATTKERQEMMRAMNEDVVRKARQQKEERIDQFLTKVIAQLRGLLYDATTNVLASMRKHERLQPRAVVQLKNLVENLELLNFYGDKDVERAMKLIGELINRPREDRDLGLIEQRLREIATVMRSTLLPLEYEFREDRLEDFDDPAARAKAFEELEKRELAGVARKPSRTEVREARMSLGFSLPFWDDTREERLEEEVVLRPSIQGWSIEEREERTYS